MASSVNPNHVLFPFIRSRDSESTHFLWGLPKAQIGEKVASLEDQNYRNLCANGPAAAQNDDFVRL
jgi:hypothetical protein